MHSTKTSCYALLLRTDTRRHVHTLLKTRVYPHERELANSNLPMNVQAGKISKNSTMREIKSSHPRAYQAMGSVCVGLNTCACVLFSDFFHQHPTCIYIFIRAGFCIKSLSHKKQTRNRFINKYRKWNRWRSDLALIAWHKHHTYELRYPHRRTAHWGLDSKVHCRRS